MKRQIASLTVREPTHITAKRILKPHAAQRLLMGNGRNQDVSIVFKADKATIEQVIDIRR